MKEWMRFNYEHWGSFMRKIFILFFALFLLCSSFSCAAKVSTAGDNVISASLILPYKDISHKYRVINKMKTQAKNLSDEEKGVVQKYIFGAVRSEDTYLLINCYLRDTLEYYIPKKEITKPLKCRLEFYANSLSKPIEKTRLPQNMILYRGIDEKGMSLIFAKNHINDLINKPINEENLEKLKKTLIGTQFTEKGFMSTSYKREAAKQTKFIFAVYAPKNLQALLLEDLGKREEKEVLINKNTKWEITDILTYVDKNTKKQHYSVIIKYVLK